MNYQSDFLFQVGLGNIWRFPYQAYQNGGAAFLVAYFIILLLVGRPMYYLEVAVGQFSGNGTVKLWDCAPLARGVGIGIVMTVTFLCIYYNVIIAYSFSFMVASVQGIMGDLPWASCGNYVQRSMLDYLA